ncbi:MAG: SufBD protein [Limnochordia bacterium]|jgi:hypothetical protein|nr:SufBD protein [Limnochordia bacterium]
MPSIQELVDGLTDDDDQRAYRCLRQLEEKSTHSAEVYQYFDTFAEILQSTNSYIRTRGMILIAANARWDTDCKIDEIIDAYLKHIHDDKPITARQCIKALPSIVKNKPELRQDIKAALLRANPMKYEDSMQPLIVKDIEKSLEGILK